MTWGVVSPGPRGAVIAQYFREAPRLRLILLMIACQKVGRQLRLTQEEMATVLAVHRGKIN